MKSIPLLALQGKGGKGHWESGFDPSQEEGGGGGGVTDRAWLAFVNLLLP